MAGAGTKRIVDLTETSEVQNGDYLAIDSTARGTKKTPVSIFAKAADLTAEQTARAAADTTLDGKITAEAQARANAIGAEQTAREEADDALTESVTALSGEVTAQGELIQNPTKTVSGAVAHFTDGADMPATSVIVSIEPQQSGTGTPSPDNVRQISGWSSVDANVTGVNVWDEEWELGQLKPTDGTPSSSTNRMRTKNLISCLPSTNYYICNTTTYTSYFYVFFYDATQTFISYDAIRGDRVFQTPQNCKYVKFFLDDAWGGQTYTGGIGINYPSTATAYEPYTGTTTPVNLGRTVYGGTLDVVSGLLTVDRAMVDMGSVDWTMAGTAPNHYFSSGNSISGAKQDRNVATYICSQYEAVSSRTTATLQDGQICRTVNPESEFFVKDSRYTSASDFKEAMNGVQLVYELAQPQTYQLTSTEVKTLLGENNVWADAGAVSVTYRRDINLALEQLEALLNS